MYVYKRYVLLISIIERKAMNLRGSRVAVGGTTQEELEGRRGNDVKIALR